MSRQSIPGESRVRRQFDSLTTRIDSADWHAVISTVLGLKFAMGLGSSAAILLQINELVKGSWSAQAVLDTSSPHGFAIIVTALIGIVCLPGAVVWRAKVYPTIRDRNWSIGVDIVTLLVFMVGSALAVLLTIGLLENGLSAVGDPTSTPESAEPLLESLREIAAPVSVFVPGAVFGAVFARLFDPARKHELRSRRVLGAVAVGLLIATAPIVAIAAVPGPASAGGTSDYEYPQDPDATFAADSKLRTASNYDDGAFGPTLPVNYSSQTQVAANLTVDDPGEIEQPLWMADYNVSRIEYAPERFNVTRMQLDTGDGGVLVDGRYYVEFREQQGDALTAMDYGPDSDAESFHAGWDYNADGTGDGTLSLERTDSVWLAVNVITPEGEVVRYVVQLDRDDVTAGDE